MSRLFYHVMQDNAGNLLFGVSGTMRLAGTGTVATIYGDEALTVILPNPMTNHPSFGSFKCYLGPGLYDFYLAKSGYTFETLTGLQGGGSLANQDASGVVITGGSIVGLSDFDADYPTLVVDNVNHRVGIGTDAPAQKLGVNGTLGVSGLAWFVTLETSGSVGVKTAALAAQAISVRWAKATQGGLYLQPSDSDTGNGPVLFWNLAGSNVGGISTTNVATAYNTTSDARLKHAVDDLTGELALVKALRPVVFRWNVDDSPGVGFLAHEIAALVQGVVTGDADAVYEDGTINPQMIDPSKLVVWLVGACKTLASKLETAEARLAVLEDALGA